MIALLFMDVQHLNNYSEYFSHSIYIGLFKELHYTVSLESFIIVVFLL